LRRPNDTREELLISLSASFRVRREKGAQLQWEEDNPPGNCRSSR
jgi:hypothetical protein